MEARLLLGSDDAQSDFGYGSDEGWDWWHWSRLRQRNMAQGFAGGQGTAAAELLTQGTAALGALGHGWEGENMKWHVGQPPSPVFISAAW